MTQPLALVYFQKPLLGNQVVNRLVDLNYRVATVSSPEELLMQARTAGPMLVLADVEMAGKEIAQSVAVLRADEATSHLPLIGFAVSKSDLEFAQRGGFTLAVETSVLLAHFEQVLEQALRLD